MAGKSVAVDEIVSIAITCKYMGWTYEEYLNQPLSLIEAVRMLRNLEAEEAQRQEKYGNK